MDATVIGGYATALGVIISIFTLAYQSYKARFNTSVQLVLEFEKRFNSLSFEFKRQQAATSILAKATDMGGAEPIFDLFETIGYLVRKGAIAEDIAWNVFYYWVHGYWTVGKMHIQQRRGYEKDVDLWSNFEYLHKRLLAIQRRTANRSEPETMIETDKDIFLNEETELGPGNAA
jgi:hypothetical protein